MSDSLQTFIHHAHGKGLDYGTIRQLLLAAGWKEKDIAHAIAAQGLDIAVPEPAGSGNARDAFLYLLSFATLYAVVASVIGLYFTFLDYLYPDPAWGGMNMEGALDGVRYAIAVIVVAFPLFLILSLVLERVLRAAPDSPTQPVARVLAYLTMFLAAALIVGDLITLLYYFLDGALTTRFVLKVVVLLVIAQVILAYFYLAPSNGAPGKSAGGRLLEALGVLIVVGATVLGFTLTGSPLDVRQARLDEKRVADLRALHSAIQEMTTKRNGNDVQLTRPLPRTLEEVDAYQQTRQSAYALSLVDPETGEKYVYTPTGEHTYELAAQFALERDKKQELFWNHPAGRHSFRFKVLSPP